MASIDLELYTDDLNEVAALRAYWQLADDGETWAQTVTAVREAYGLKQREMQRLVQESATAFVPQVKCPQCNAPHTVNSRSQFNDVIRRGNVLCTFCALEAQHAREEEARNRAARRRAALCEAFPVRSGDTVEVPQLSLFEAVALHALLSDPALEDAGLTTPTNLWPAERRWAPPSLRWDYERRILNRTPAVLRVHPDSHPDAFVWEDEAPDGSYYLGAASYYLIGPEEDLPQRHVHLLAELNRTFREGPWPAAWLNQWRDLWEELSLAHASAYLDMKLGEHHLEMKQGDGTKTALADALATFSLGQVFNFIYRATKDSAAYYQRGGVNKRQAANSTVGRISAAADRARVNGWEIKSFGMPWNLPFSAIAETFFSKVMWQADMMQVALRDAQPPAHVWASEEGPEAE